MLILRLAVTTVYNTIRDGDGMAFGDGSGYLSIELKCFLFR